MLKTGKPLRKKTCAHYPPCWFFQAKSSFVRNQWAWWPPCQALVATKDYSYGANQTSIAGTDLHDIDCISAKSQHLISPAFWSLFIITLGLEESVWFLAKVMMDMMDPQKRSFDAVWNTKMPALASWKSSMSQIKWLRSYRVAAVRRLVLIGQQKGPVSLGKHVRLPQDISKNSWHSDADFTCELVERAPAFTKEKGCRNWKAIRNIPWMLGRNLLPQLG